MIATDLLCDGPAPVAGPFWSPREAHSTGSETELIILQRLHELSLSVHDLGTRLGPVLQGNDGQVQSLGGQLQQMKVEIFKRLDSAVLVKKPPQPALGSHLLGENTDQLAVLNQQTEVLKKLERSVDTLLVTSMKSKESKATSSQRVSPRLWSPRLKFSPRIPGSVLAQAKENVAAQVDSLQTAPMGELKMRKDSLPLGSHPDNFPLRMDKLTEPIGDCSQSKHIHDDVQAHTARLQKGDVVAGDADRHDHTGLQVSASTPDQHHGADPLPSGIAHDCNENHPPQSGTQSPEPQAVTLRVGAFADKQVPEILEEESQAWSSRSNSRSMQRSRTNTQSSLNTNKTGGLLRAKTNLRKSLGSDVALDEQEYDVSQHYHKEGYAQAIAKSEIFQNLTLTIIALNAAYMGVHAEHNTEDNLNDALVVFIVTENVFCIFFSFELLVRCSAFKVKRDIVKDSWMKFDALLLVIFWWETWIMPLFIHFTNVNFHDLPTGPLKLMRLLRLARLARLLRSFPELVILIKAMFAATRAVSSATVLLIIALYAWSIAMHTFMKDDPALDDKWGTIPRCMMTLFANGTLGDSVGEVMTALAKSSNWFALCAFIVFVILSALTVLNMLVGILCEVMAQVALAERDSASLARLKSTVLNMLQSMDHDSSGDISKHELLELLQETESVRVAQELNIDMTYFIDELDMHYQETEVVQIAQIMKLLIASQGDEATTVAHLCSFNNFNMWSMRNMIESVKDAVNGPSHTSKLLLITQDLAAIKKDIASLMITSHYGNAGHSMRQIDKKPFAVPVMPRDDSHSLISPSPSIPAPAGIDLDDFHQALGSGSEGNVNLVLGAGYEV